MALSNLRETGKQVSNRSKVLEKQVKEMTANVRKEQEVLQKLLAEDHMAEAEASFVKEREQEEKAKAVEAAKAAKVAKLEAKRAEEAAKKAEFEARVKAKQK